MPSENVVMGIDLALTDHQIKSTGNAVLEGLNVIAQVFSQMKSGLRQGRALLN